MKTLTLSLLASLLIIESAQAGSAQTSLACSSVSGKTIVSGFLPGPGEDGIQIHVSETVDMYSLTNDQNSTSVTATVTLDAEKEEVLILVKGSFANFTIRSASPADTRLSRDNTGTSGSFTGILTGTNPTGYQNFTPPVSLRCYVSNRI